MNRIMNLHAPGMLVVLNRIYKLIMVLIHLEKNKSTTTLFYSAGLRNPQLILLPPAVEWSGEVRSITYSADGKTVSVVYRVTLYGTDAEVYY